MPGLHVDVVLKNGCSGVVYAMIVIFSVCVFTSGSILFFSVVPPIDSAIMFASHIHIKKSLNFVNGAIQQGQTSAKQACCFGLSSIPPDYAIHFLYLW